jgi:hypothetical protein
MQVGDLIRFVSTGCHGIITRLESTQWEHTPTFAYVLCGADVDGDRCDEPLAFPVPYLARVAEVICESR